MTEKQMADSSRKNGKPGEIREELLRTEVFRLYEHRFEEKGLIAGVDEVGRGPSPVRSWPEP